MKVFSFPIAFVASMTIVLGLGAGSLFLTSEFWRRSVAAQIAELVQADDVSGATQYLKGAVLPWWLNFRLGNIGGIAAGMSARRDHTTSATEIRDSSLANWLSVATERVAELAALQSATRAPNAQLAQLTAEQTTTSQDIARLTTRYRLIAAGASELFQLELANEAPVFYQSGLLSGLPILKDLPEGINTLPQLSAAITKAGGVVVSTEFTRSLSALLDEGGQIQRGLVQAQQRLKDAKEAESTLIRDLTTQRLRRQQQVATEFESEAQTFSFAVGF